MSWLLNLGAYTMTALLALLGILVTIFGPSTSNVKAFWVFLFVVVACGSIGLNFLQKQEEEKINSTRDKQLETQGKRIESLLKALGVSSDPEHIGQSLNRAEDLSAKARGKVDNLKYRIAELSTSILRFLLDRARSEPPSPRLDTWSQDVDRLIRNSTETMNLYSLSFGSRVIAARNELAGQGLIDSELDRFYEHPTNPIGIRIVAERLGALAQRLPD